MIIYHYRVSLKRGTSLIPCIIFKFLITSGEHRCWAHTRYLSQAPQPSKCPIDVIAIAIAKEIQGFWIGRFCKFWASEFSSTLARSFPAFWFFFAKTKENSEGQNLQNFLQSFVILGSLLQWRWQWASIGHFVFFLFLKFVIGSHQISESFCHSVGNEHFAMVSH